MKIKFLFITYLLLQCHHFALASSDHSHKQEHEHEEKGHQDSKHDDHADHDNHSDHDHETSKSVGKDFAIEVNDEHLGIKLSDKALKNLNIETKQITSSKVILPKEAIVLVRDQTFVYFLRERFFKLVAVKIKERRDAQYTVVLNDFNSIGAVVTKGADLIRISEVYANDTASYGHSH